MSEGGRPVAEVVWPPRSTVPRNDSLEPVVDALRSGGMIVYPTETVYGLGTAVGAGNAGLARIRAAKGSPPGRPFLVLAADVGRAFALWARVPPLARRLAAAAWPGPLTLVGAARDGLPSDLLGLEGDVPTVSVRVPGDARLRCLLQRLGDALVSTSANLSGEPAPRSLGNVSVAALSPDLVVDGGVSSAGPPSTLISVVGAPRILRAGAWDLPAEFRGLADEEPS